MEVGASSAGDLPVAESSLSLPICSMESHSFIQETLREIRAPPSELSYKYTLSVDRRNYRKGGWASALEGWQGGVRSGVDGVCPRVDGGSALLPHRPLLLTAWGSSE